MTLQELAKNTEALRGQAAKLLEHLSIGEQLGADFPRASKPFTPGEMIVALKKFAAETLNHARFARNTATSIQEVTRRLSDLKAKQELFAKAHVHAQQYPNVARKIEAAMTLAEAMKDGFKPDGDRG